MMGDGVIDIAACARGRGAGLRRLLRGRNLLRQLVEQADGRGADYLRGAAQDGGVTFTV